MNQAVVYIIVASFIGLAMSSGITVCNTGYAVNIRDGSSVFCHSGKEMTAFKCDLKSCKPGVGSECMIADIDFGNVVFRCDPDDPTTSVIDTDIIECQVAQSLDQFCRPRYGQKRDERCEVTWGDSPHARCQKTLVHPHCTRCSKIGH